MVMILFEFSTYLKKLIANSSRQEQLTKIVIFFYKTFLHQKFTTLGGIMSQRDAIKSFVM